MESGGQEKFYNCLIQSKELTKKSKTLKSIKMLRVKILLTNVKNGMLTTIYFGWWFLDLAAVLKLIQIKREAYLSKWKSSIA